MDAVWSKEGIEQCIDSVGSGSRPAILATDAFGLPLMTRWKARERVLYPLVRDDSDWLRDGVNPHAGSMLISSSYDGRFLKIVRIPAWVYVLRIRVQGLANHCGRIRLGEVQRPCLLATLPVWPSKELHSIRSDFRFFKIAVMDGAADWFYYEKQVADNNPNNQSYDGHCVEDQWLKP
jgi:hypothetical protein